MSTIRSLTSSLLLLALLFLFADAAPQNNRNGKNNRGKGNRGGAATQQTPQQRAAAIPQGESTATDGSTILDMTATINGADIRFKVSAPADQFTTQSGVTGGTQAPGTQGANGLNVLLHGDGGQSFFDFPNQAAQGGLMGVAVLAPSQNLLWGQRTGPAPGLNRADGSADSQAVADLVKTVLPTIVAFNSSNVFFTGVSGGALTLSGFFVPEQMTNFAGSGVLLMCAALAPQSDFVNATNVLSTTPIHFQTTQGELASLQQAFPGALRAYSQLAAQSGLSTAQINTLMTVDATPGGGHCAFDGQGFVSGIQLVSDNYAAIMQDRTGVVPGINTQSVLKGVVGRENVAFGPPQKRGVDSMEMMYVK